MPKTAPPEIQRPGPTLKGAGELNATHIGMPIRFMLRDSTREIATVTTAELRQIGHDGSQTHLTYGELGERESTLPHGHPVVLWPAEDFSDVDLFKVGYPDEDDERPF